MKKAISMLLAMLIAFGACAAAITAPDSVIAEATEATTQEGNFVYEIINEGAVITDYADPESTDPIVIPESLGGYPVTEIAPKAFCDCMCTSVTVPSTVADIDPTAFAYNMPNIEKYIVAEGNTTYYSDDKGILYSKTLGYPFIDAYPKNSSAKTLSLSFTTMGSGINTLAFSEVKNLEEIEIDCRWVFGVGNYAFNCAEDLKSVTITNCNVISDGAFYGCSSLTDVNLTNLIYVEWDVFKGTPFINDKTKYDADGVFYYNDCLINTLPEADKQTYTIKSGTKSIAGGAFDWDSLTSVVIPSSINNISSNPFGLCANLKNIDVSASTKYTVDEYGVLYGKSGNNLILISYPNGRYRSCFVVKPETIHIASHAFDYSPVRNFYLNSGIEIIYPFGLGGSSVTDVHYEGDEAAWAEVDVFETESGINYLGRQDALQTADIHFSDYSEDTHTILTKTDNYSYCSCGYRSDTAVSNGEYTENGFTYRVVNGKAEITGCSSYVIGKMYIPETIGGLTVTGIGGYAFDLCNCNSVHIPATVEYIETDSGLWSLSSLEEITVDADNANYSAENGILYNKDKTTLLLYPDAKAGNAFEIPSHVKTIGSRAFSNSDVFMLTVPGNVKTIENEAFYYCTYLTDLIIEEGVEHIGDYAFYYSYKLINISLADGIKYIGKEAFGETLYTRTSTSYDSDKVAYLNNYLIATNSRASGGNYDIKEGTVLIAGGVFEWKKITSISVPASVRSIGNAAFNGCEMLESINIAADSEYFCNNAQGAVYTKDMKALVAYPMARKQACFAVPEGVTEIRPYALDCDYMLSNKYIPSSVKTIGAYGIGANPDMTINYQGTQAQWESIAFKTDKYTEKDYPDTINGIKKNYGVYTSAHALADNVTADATCKGTGTETITCTCGYSHVNIIPANGHKATGSFVVITPATCTQAEIEGRYCSVCGEIAERCIRASLGHDFEAVEQDATCTESGGTFNRCKRCGLEEGESIIPATGHTPGEWTVQTAASCTNDGLEILPCTVCGEVIESKVIEGGHKYVATVVEPTCTKDGGEYTVCEVCGEETLDPETVTPATGHTPGEWTVRNAATCTSDGLEIIDCTVCGRRLESRIIEGGHKYASEIVKETCTMTTTHYCCMVCGNDYYEDVYTSNTHGELVEVIEDADCINEGRKYMKCTVCNAIIGNTTYIPPEGHDLSEVTVREATCTEQGERLTECSRCDYEKTEAIPKESHVFGKWVYESGNVFSGKCAVCGDGFESLEVALTLDRTRFSIVNGGTDKLTASATENISTDFIFTSDNENIVSVDRDGTVIAKKTGTATVTARLNGTDITAQCKITVVPNVYPVSWMVDGDVHHSGTVEEGQKITSPSVPVKEGFEFVGWTPEIPEVMPSNAMAFTAVFNEVTESKDYDVRIACSPEAFGGENVTLDVAPVTGEREPGGVYMVEGEYYEQIGIYNIKTLGEDSEVIQPLDGYRVTVKMAIPEKYKNRTDFMVYHRFVDGGRERLSTADGTLRVENGYFVFEVSKFSEFEFFVPKAIAGIKITKLPDKIKYSYKTDDKINLTGIRIKFTDSNGKTRTVSNPDLLNATGFNSSKIGKQTIVVNYGHFYDTFEVEVTYSWWQMLLKILSLGLIRF